MKQDARRKEKFDMTDLNIEPSNELFVIFDIGANTGDEIRIFLNEIPNSKIYAFEADSRPFVQLRDRYMSEKRVECFNSAIADRDGSIEFHPSSGYHPCCYNEGEYTASGSLLKPTKHLQYHPTITFPNTEVVECSRLDSFIARTRISRIDLLWMDVQGAEMNVLEGLGVAISTVKRIYTEYSLEELYEGQKTLPQIAEFLETKGFVLDTLYPFDALFLRP